MSTNQPPAETTKCPSCGRNVPAGEFCGACGTHLTSGSAGRLHAYAAHPGEHVLHFAAVSTLFPHLPHRHTAPFRLALVGAALLLPTLTLLGLTATAIAAACLIVPLLYVVYLYETEVYEDEPILVIGATFVLGIALAIPWVLWTAPYVTATLVLNSFPAAPVTRDVISGVLIPGVLIPLGAQCIILIGPLALYGRKYHEALDGFAFGAASALGFTLTANLIDLWPQLAQGATTSSPTFNSALVIVARGLLIPFVAASTAGLIAGAVWLRKGKIRYPQALGWTTTLPVIGVAVALLWCFLGLVNIFVSSIGLEVAIYFAAAVVLLLAVRVSLHHMLLAEAEGVTVGADHTCFHCHYVVPAMAFCPHCGVAVRSTPKHGAHRPAQATS